MPEPRIIPGPIIVPGPIQPAPLPGCATAGAISAPLSTTTAINGLQKVRTISSGGLMKYARLDLVAVDSDQVFLSRRNLPPEGDF